jgi:hypothetical protein
VEVHLVVDRGGLAGLELCKWGMGVGLVGQRVEDMRV